MIMIVRTTISLDDRLGEAARRRAAAERSSLSALIARALVAYLTRVDEPADTVPFRLITVGGGGPYPGIDLDRTSELLVAEDRERFGKPED